MLTIHDVPDYKADAQKAGAVAYIPKHMMHKELIPTLEKLLTHQVDNAHNPAPSKKKVNGILL